MTTKAAAALYLAQHLHDVDERKIAFYSPQNKPLEELPIIYGFNNGGDPGWMDAVALSADGHVLGGHVCSDEGYMPYDLGILENSRSSKPEGYRKHYPDGYKMEFVPSENISSHEGLQAALAAHRGRIDE